MNAPVIFVADAWGSRLGGINAFNTDLCCALAKQLGSARQVVCIVLNGNSDDEAAATGSGVILLPTGGDHLDSGKVWQTVKQAGLATNGWWVGHDVITGEVALLAAKHGGGRAALIHHMSYGAYIGYRNGNSQEADRREQNQQQLFRRAAHCFAVGHLLHNRLCDLLVSIQYPPIKPTILIPGLQDIQQLPTNSQFTAIMSGRMGRQDASIKLGRLAVAAFAAARKFACETPGSPPSLVGQRPRIKVIGIDTPGSKEEKSLRTLANKYGNPSPPDVFALPFLTDRNKLFDMLAKANVALMPSWHEGFGLVGWEAIAAGVPLIVSKESGLVLTVKELVGGMEISHLKVVSIGGHCGKDGDENFSSDDVKAVRNAILDIAANEATWRDRAKELREKLLAAGVTWDNTAKTMAKALNLDVPDLSMRAAGHQKTPVSPGDKESLFDSYSVNSLPNLVDMTIASTQGSSATLFDLLPELRFGTEEIRLADGEDKTESWVKIGLSEATLRAELTNCEIEAGVRLGDKNHPTIRSESGDKWRIIGPKDTPDDKCDLLRSLVIGTDVLCRVKGMSDSLPSVTLVVECLQYHIRHTVVHGNAPPLSETHKRVLDIFLSKCLGTQNGILRLCEATLKVKDNS